ncbi:MAG: VanZ family protein [Bryobacteraceae bacterium]|nr:VanZ family protein [Bryobacteraceae bacterium]
MVRLLIVVIAFIVYGSLYPWRFVQRHLNVNPAWLVLHAWPKVIDVFLIKDAILNVALYVPLGFFLCLALKGRPAMQVTGAMLLGFALSMSIEMAQIFDFKRHPSSLDILTNTIGSLLGALLALVAPTLLPRSLRQPGPHSQRLSAAAALLLIWLLSRLFPFFPVIGLWTVGHKWRAFVVPGFEFLPFVSAAAVWYVTGRLLRRLALPKLKLWLVASLLLVPLQIFVASRQPRLSEMAGALTGVALFVLAGNIYSEAVAAAFLMLLVVLGVSPFRFSGEAQAFGWYPFGGALESAWQSAIGTLLGKCYLYGTAVWLMLPVFRSESSGASIRAVALVAALLAAIEWAQIWIPGRTPEVTDPLLAVIMGIGLYLLRDRQDSKGIRR